MVEVDGGELIGLECPSKNEKDEINTCGERERVNIFNVCSADQSTKAAGGAHQLRCRAHGEEERSLNLQAVRRSKNSPESKNRAEKEKSNFKETNFGS